MIGENLAKVFFMARGFTVLTPETHETSYDFVIELDGDYKRVQVKTDVVHKNLVRFRNKHGSSNSFYEVTDYDILAGVWIEKKRIYLFDSKLVNNREHGETITVSTTDETPLMNFKRYEPYFVGDIV